MLAVGPVPEGADGRTLVFVGVAVIAIPLLFGPVVQVATLERAVDGTAHGPDLPSSDEDEVVTPNLSRPGQGRSCKQRPPTGR